MEEGTAFTPAHYVLPAFHMLFLERFLHHSTKLLVQLYCLRSVTTWRNDPSLEKALGKKPYKAVDTGSL